MTKREKELYEIIRDNPSISQNEIAQKMNISRSAVSVYLNDLYKKKILLGRGYILNERKHPVAIGPAHIDIRNVADNAEPNASGNYITSQTQLTYGGATKNIIDYLFNFAQQPRSILVLGDDELGRSYMDSCVRLGISPSDFIVLKDTATSFYNELIDEQRNIIFSFHSKMDQMMRITPLDIYAHADVLSTANMLILHDSVPLSVIEYLSTSYPELPIFMVGSSKQYLSALKDSYHRFYASILSFDIAAYITWGRIVTEISSDSITNVCRMLIQKGLKNFYIMAAPYTIVYCDGCQIMVHSSDNPSFKEGTNQSHYYSDCRDVMAAIICYHLLNQDEELPLLDYLAAARNLVNSRDFYFNRDISINLLAEHAAKLESKIIVRSLYS